MNSLSKTPLTLDLAQAVAAHHFGSQRSLRTFEELKDGFFNSAAHLVLDDGLSCVLKAAPPDSVSVMRYEYHIMQAEVQAMRLVRQQTSVPVPEIYAYDTSRQLLPVDYFVMEFLPGQPFNKLRPSLDAHMVQAVEHEMGRLTSEISQITHSAFGYLARPEEAGGSWRECFARMVGGVMMDGIEMDVSLPLPYDELFRGLERHFDALDEIQTPRLVHWDLWDGNVFVDPLTGKITGLIDFERALWGDPLTEAIFGGLDPQSPAVQGYGSPMLTTSNQRRRRLLYNIYLWLIMIIECSFRKYETNDQENWVRPKLDEDLQRLRDMER